MPNFLTHLAVAKRYAQKNNITGQDARDFYDGNVHPDLGVLHNNNLTKEQRHYNKKPPSTLAHENYCKDRVDFAEFLAKNKVETHFERGILMHLIVDNYCYREVLDMEKFFNLVYSTGIDARWVLKCTFNSKHDYLIEKYAIDYNITGRKEIIEQSLERWEKDAVQCTAVYDLLDTEEKLEKLDAFIERISSLNLDDFIASYLDNNK